MHSNNTNMYNYNNLNGWVYTKYFRNLIDSKYIPDNIFFNIANGFLYKQINAEFN